MNTVEVTTLAPYVTIAKAADDREMAKLERPSNAPERIGKGESS